MGEKLEIHYCIFGSCLKLVLSLHLQFYLKDKSGVGIIAGYSRDYTVVNGGQYFFQLFLF